MKKMKLKIRLGNKMKKKKMKLKIVKIVMKYIILLTAKKTKIIKVKRILMIFLKLK